MPISILLHVTGEDPIVGDVEEMPTVLDTSVIVNNPRRRDDKDLPYLHETVTTVIWPMHRVNFIEILPSKEEEDLIGFVRE
jgi:hypothetical protein